MPLPQVNRDYTIEDIYNLPEGKRAELIEGQIYDMAPPSRQHQKILMEISYQIKEYIKSKGGACDVYPAPFAVFINADKNYLEPDISVICDPDKLTDQGCNGAPDWIIEITSPGNAGHDYLRKLNLYNNAGVREYWIVDPQEEKILVYFFEADWIARSYTFKDKVKVNIYGDLEMDFNDIVI
jgi:Uma2 family endonuclease